MTTMTADTAKIFPGWQDARARRWIWGAVLAVVVFTGAVRLRLAETPLERDEGEYAYTGQLMLAGVPPYQGSYFMKLPGTHAMYALGMAIFGQTRAGIHRWLLVVNAVTIVMIFLLGRKLADPDGGTDGLRGLRDNVAEPMRFGADRPCHAVRGVVRDGGNFDAVQGNRVRESGGVFFERAAAGARDIDEATGSVLCRVRRIDNRVVRMARAAVRWGALIRRVALYSFGVVVPYAVTCLILWRAGVFERFWFWTVTCVRTYGTALPLAQGLKNLGDYFLVNLDPSMVLWFLAIAGAVCIWKDREAGVARVIIPVLLVVSLAAVGQGMYFRPHYFIMLLPALALALGAGANSMRRLILKAKPESALAGMPAKYIAAALLVVVAGQWKFFFVMPPNEVCRQLYYPGESFVESIEIANFIKDHSVAGDQIAIVGSEPQICFYAGRRSATGYIYTYDMMDAGPFATRLQQEMIRQIEAARPQFLLYVNLQNSWGGAPTSQLPLVDWQSKYCREFYEQVGKVVFPTGKPPTFCWGTEAIAAAPLRQECIDIFRRKESAPGHSATR